MTVRLACFRHAASVYPEPGSNSPSKPPHRHPPRDYRMEHTDKGSPSLAPHHSSIVNVPRHPGALRRRPGPSSERRRDSIGYPTGRSSGKGTPRRSMQRTGARGVALAPTYCPGRLPAEYRRRWGVSRPCSGWERVGPPRPRHQGHAPLLVMDGREAILSALRRARAG